MPVTDLPKINPCNRCGESLVRECYTLRTPPIWSIDHWCHDGEVRGVQGDSQLEARSRWNAMNPVQARVDSPEP